MFKTLKTVAASMLLAFAMLATPAMANHVVSEVFGQNISPSGDACWTPVEAQADLVKAGYVLERALTDEEIETVKANLIETEPALEGQLSFTYMELYVVPGMDDDYFVALYIPEESLDREDNVENEGEVCFWNFFSQTKGQIAELLKP